MGKFTVNNLKSLANTISGVVDQVEQKDVSTAFANSLTEKALQLNEEKHEKEESPAEEKAEDKAEMLMKRLAAKALKRAKKKAATNEEVELAEKAAPGYENWASDPKVKASFKKQYGKDWKQVMYGRSWNMKKMDEESEQLDEISDTLLFRARAKAKGVGKFKVRTNPSFAGSSKDVPLHKKITKELQRRGSVPVSESEQLDELSNQLLHRAKYASWVKRKLSKKTGEALDKKINRELLRRGDVHADRPRERRRSRSSEDWMSEDVQLNEAGYKKLMRIKGAAYKAELASRGADPNTSLQGLVKAAKLKRAAAEREAQVAAGMARRGGASPDAVRGGGSRIGKSGKYTQKAGALANQRDKALAKFRGRAGYNKAQGMSRSSTEKQISRNTQQFRDDIRNRSRSGDFGQDNQAALRARSNFQKRFGRLKGK